MKRQHGLLKRGGIRLGQRSMHPKILFVAEHINQAHGSALSAIDVLRSIPPNYKKYILSDQPIPTGSYLHNAVRLSWQPPPISIRPRRLSRVLSNALRSIYGPLFRRWLRTAGFDAVIVNGFGSYALWEKIRGFIPGSTTLSVVSRESPRHFDLRDRAHTLADQRRFLSSFDSHIFVSENLREEWVALANLNPDRTFYLPNCCDEQPLLSIRRDGSQCSSIREDYAIPNGIPLILNVGTIELRKGQQDLELLARHLQANIPDFRIACVGFVATEEGAKFRRRIEDSPIGSFFLFPGSTDKVTDWYAAATMLVFTSRAEAMPRTVLEAMASALPIISTNVDGIPELIEHLSEGYLYHPGDITSLIEGTRIILESPDTAREMGLAARARYINRFSRTRHAQRMERVLHQILQSNSDATE